MTVIKICGITSPADAIQVASMDVQIVGLVFARSRRRVSPERAEEICSAVKKLPGRPAVAGVFVNTDPQVINETVRLCGLDLVQLSGDESFEDCRLINAPVIKAVHIAPASRSADIAGQISGSAQGNPVLYLLDTGDALKYGGTGKSFDWHIAREIAASQPVLIAGGLDPLNVSGLIRSVKPMGVDVSSGVETGGRKDIAKIRAFVEAVRTAEMPSPDSGDVPDKYIMKGESNVA